MRSINLFAAAKGLSENRLPGNNAIILRTLQDKYGILGEDPKVATEDQIFSLINHARIRALTRSGDSLHPLDEAFAIICKAISERDQLAKDMIEAGKDPVNVLSDQNDNPGQLTIKHSVSDVYTLIRDIYAFECPSGQSVDSLDEINEYVRSGFGPVQFPTDPDHSLKEWKALLEKAIGSETFYARDEVNRFFNDITAGETGLEAEAGKHEKPPILNAPVSAVPAKPASQDPGLQNRSLSDNKGPVSSKTKAKGVSSPENSQAAEDLMLSIMDRKRSQGWTWEKIRSYFKGLITKEG